MDAGALDAALEREHREIDAGIEGFSSEQLSAEERRESLQRAIDALRRHIYLEEEFLFPPMQADLAIPTMVMLREHGEIWRSLDQIEAQLDGDDSREAVGQACSRLLIMLASHNGKEEPIFYAAADATLSADGSAELKNLIDSGQMPLGWTCKQAGLG